MGGLTGWGRTVVTFVVWNGGMYQVVRYQSYILVALLYLVFSTLLVLKLLQTACIVPTSLPAPSVSDCYDRVNALCSGLHRKLKGAQVLVFAWAGVKVAVYSRLLGTLGVCWVAGNLAWVQRTARVHFDIDILASILAFRRKVLSAIIGLFSRKKDTLGE